MTGLKLCAALVLIIMEQNKLGVCDGKNWKKGITLFNVQCIVV